MPRTVSAETAKASRITLHLKGTETTIDIVSDEDVDKAGGTVGRTLGP
jgi:hypothetical protein